MYSEENPVESSTLGLLYPMEENPVFEVYEPWFLSKEDLRGWRLAPGT